MTIQEMAARFAKAAEAGLSISLGVSAGGYFVLGKPISEKEYFDRLRHQIDDEITRFFEARNQSASMPRSFEPLVQTLYDGLAKPFHDKVDEVYRRRLDETANTSTPEYLNLGDAFIFMGSKPLNVRGIHWRVRIDSITGITTELKRGDS